MKLLVVDDSKVMRLMISGAAETLGYEVIEAGDGREALQKLQTEAENIDAITLDITMPVMDGIACLEAIKANPDFSKIPVIMVSAESEKQSVLEAIRMGARHYVTKPFRSEDITTRLAEVLDLDDEF